MPELDLAILHALCSLDGEASISQLLDLCREASESSLKGAEKEATNQSVFRRRIIRHMAALELRRYVVRQRGGSFSLTYLGLEWLLNELAYRAPDSPILSKERLRDRFVIPVEVERLEEGGYLARCEAIQGCHAEGNTVAEALENLEDAASVLLQLQRDEGLPFPDGLEKFSESKILKAQLIVPHPG